jgi:hypothetical protein
MLLVVAACSVIEKKQLITRHRHSMLAYRRYCVRQASGELTQRRELIPVLCRIAQNPFNVSGVVVDRDDKVFPAGNDE